MIQNELEYKITKSELAKFEDALSQLAVNQPDSEAWMLDLQRGAMQSQLEELRAQVAEYEQLRSSLLNQQEVLLELTQLSDLPTMLIRARIAKGWTQGQLAERLGVRVQQVQNDEATLYQSASFARLNKIATALGVVVREAKVLVGR